MLRQCWVHFLTTRCPDATGRQSAGTAHRTAVLEHMQTEVVKSLKLGMTAEEAIWLAGYLRKVTPTSPCPEKEWCENLRSVVVTHKVITLSGNNWCHLHALLQNSPDPDESRADEVMRTAFFYATGMPADFGLVSG